MTTTPTAFPELPDLDKLEAPFQARVEPWMAACFGPRISADTTERNHRFIEEARELVQAGGMPKSEVLQLVDYTYGRPVGEQSQEVGGVMVTLAALCLAQGLDMHDAAEVELARIWTKVEAIRAKQLTKPRGSPLPAPAASLSPLCGAQHAESGKEAVAAMRVIGGQRWSKEAEMTEGWLAAQQAAAPGALDADEMTRLRRLMSALGHADAFELTDDYVRGILCTVLGQAAGELERATLAAISSAPGTPEAPAKLPRLYRFDCYVGKTKMAAGVGVHATSMEEAEQKARKLADKDETIKFESNQPCHVTRKCGICAAYERAAQLDGGQGEAR
jgi:hypothetical protein